MASCTNFRVSHRWQIQCWNELLGVNVAEIKAKPTVSTDMQGRHFCIAQGESYVIEIQIALLQLRRSTSKVLSRNKTSKCETNCISLCIGLDSYFFMLPLWQLCVYRYVWPNRISSRFPVWGRISWILVQTRFKGTTIDFSLLRNYMWNFRSHTHVTSWWISRRNECAKFYLTYPVTAKLTAVLRTDRGV